MNLLKLIGSLEDLVIEIALWLILLPRTLFAAIFTPVKLAKYFDHIQTIPREDRNDEYLSPVLFWILLAPISLILMIARTDQEALTLYGAGWEERIATAILMLLGPPLGFALAFVLVRREGISRNSLRRHFALQCYFHAPMAIFFVGTALPKTQASDTIRGAVFFVGLAWFLITQFRVARRENEPGRATGSIAMGSAMGCLLMIAIGGAIWLLFFLIGRTTGFGR